MKKCKSFIPLTLLLIFSSSLTLYSFTDLMREYRQFEYLITQDSSTIHLNRYPSEINDYNSEPTSITRSPQKKWTFIVYMASDNDLRAFAANNIRQMAAIGSNEHINIIAHLDIRLNGNQKVTRRYFIEKNKLSHMNTDAATQHMDSGDPNTLISCCNWAIQNFPAEHYALIFWNHGTGIIDPKNYKIINPAELFSFNPRTQKLELDRSVGFLDFLYFCDLEQRGICWDNTTGNYLSNEKLEYALGEIYKHTLHKKFSIIGFDACLMSMIEIAHILKKYADVMVGSQEVELGTGWNYTYVLEPFTHTSLGAKEFAHHIVDAYKRSYASITNDFTQSAVDLEHSHLIEQNINEVAQLLLSALRYQQHSSVINAIKISRNRKNCTHFDEPSYIDLHHFYSNLQNNLKQCKLKKGYQQLIPELMKKIEYGKKLIVEVAFSNAAGKNVNRAKGISIYFPELRIHPSYPKTSFAQSNSWHKLIELSQ